MDCLFVEGGPGHHNTTLRRNMEYHLESLDPKDKAPTDADDIGL